MLTAIVQHSGEPVAFVAALNMALYEPQMRHLIHWVDASPIRNETKTISGRYLFCRLQNDHGVAGWQSDTIQARKIFP